MFSDLSVSETLSSDLEALALPRCAALDRTVLRPSVCITRSDLPGSPMGEVRISWAQAGQQLPGRLAAL